MANLSSIETQLFHIYTNWYIAVVNERFLRIITYLVDKVNDKKWQIIKDGLMEYPFKINTHKSFEILSIIIFGNFE